MLPLLLRLLRKSNRRGLALVLAPPSSANLSWTHRKAEELAGGPFQKAENTPFLLDSIASCPLTAWCVYFYLELINKNLTIANHRLIGTGFCFFSSPGPVGRITLSQCETDRSDKGRCYHNIKSRQRGSSHFFHEWVILRGSAQEQSTIPRSPISTALLLRSKSRGHLFISGIKIWVMFFSNHRFSRRELESTRSLQKDAHRWKWWRGTLRL